MSSCTSRRTGAQTDLSQEHAFIDDVEFHKLLGICLSEIDRPREALEHFRHFVELGGKDPEVARRAGICCVNAGDFLSGLKYLEEAEKLGMARSELTLPMALASVQLKDFTGAELLLKEAEKNSSLDTDKIRQIRGLLASESLNGAPRHCRTDCGPPGVSLCMIAKDEHERISGCLESVHGLVDEIIVVDTGSGDWNEGNSPESCGAESIFFSVDRQLCRSPQRIPAARDRQLDHISGRR